jgi:hypothetical protein
MGRTSDDDIWSKYTGTHAAIASGSPARRSCDDRHKPFLDVCIGGSCVTPPCGTRQGELRCWRNGENHSRRMYVLTLGPCDRRGTESIR